MCRRQAFGVSAEYYWVRLIACLAVLLAVAACGSHPTRHARSHYNPSRYYPPPGPANDPWGPYIHEASGRYGVPELWIRRVMRQESGGQEDVISWAGAMGLMQVMPETYDGLRDRYHLGDDPFDPHNNILAGTAYLREMYDRYGAPGFLAAYNAGPNRLDAYLNSGAPLPDETVNYVASIAPLLGDGTPMSGPLSVYAGPAFRLAVQRTPSGCDPDAAFNPGGPCTPLRAAGQPVVAAAVATAPAYAPPRQQGACDPDAAYDPTRPCQPLAVASTEASPPNPQGACDPDAAYDPAHPCQPLAVRPAQPALSDQQGGCNPDAAYDPAHPCQPLTVAPALVVAQPLPPIKPSGRTGARRTGYAAGARPIQENMSTPVAFVPGPPPGHWAIQVGAFASLASAEAAAEDARSALPETLRTAKIELPRTAPFGRQVAFRARLFGLSAAAAAGACAQLNSRGVTCMTVPPARNSF